MTSKAHTGGSHTVEVQTFGSEDKAAVTLPHSCSCKEALLLISERLKIKLSSLQVFSLFVGVCGKPTKLLFEQDTVPSGTNLCLQRWNLQVDRESKLVKHDDNAIHLLFAEAKFNLDIGNIHPSEQQRLELESFSDPFFPTERQFLDVIRRIPSYSSQVARDCTVVKDIETNDIRIPAGTVVKIVMNLDGLSLQALSDSEKDKVLIEWQWSVVKRWKRTGNDAIMFEVCLPKLNAAILSWVSFKTTQAHFLFQVSGILCAELKSMQDKLKPGYDPAEGNPHFAGTYVDPVKEFINSALFKAPTFSTFK